MKNWFKKKPKMVEVNYDNIDEMFNFDDMESCRTFLKTLHLGDKKVDYIQLTNNQRVVLSEVPDEEIIERACQLRDWIKGLLQEAKTCN